MTTTIEGRLQQGGHGSPKQAKGYKGLPMEGLIARWYARNTANDMPEFRKLAEELAGKVKLGSSVLEVAPGPGYLAIELAKLGTYRIVGLDISHTFVAIATENAKKAGVTVAFCQGDAGNLPFISESFDFVVCRAAFKNFTQ